MALLIGKEVIILCKCKYGNPKKKSEFICLKCLDWKFTYIQGIQRVKQREIGHIKETLDFNIREIREDIRRLESFQSENAKLREEMSLLKQSVRSLHKRLDIEIPDSIRNHDED